MDRIRVRNLAKTIVDALDERSHMYDGGHTYGLPAAGTIPYDSMVALVMGHIAQAFDIDLTPKPE